MQSMSLLPALREVPAERQPGSRRSYRDQVQALYRADAAMIAAETAAATSFAMWGLFDTLNVDDTLTDAYAQQYPGLAADHSLYDQWQEITQRGADSADGFLNGLKGKVAEFNTVDVLENHGYTNVHIAESATQPGWDISAVDANGAAVLWQVKTGGAEYAGDAQSAILDNPEVQFAVSSEIYDHIAENSPELTERLLDVGSDFDLVEGIEDGLETLVDNLGIDLPDGLGDVLPYAGAIMAGARLIYGALQTERQFKHIDRTERNKVQVIQALTTMSRIGVTTVLATAGGAGGGAIGTAVPLLGNVVGGIAGGFIGAGIGVYLNQHLQPHMLNLALDITGLTEDDLIYYKNKPTIDNAAYEFQDNAANLRLALAQPWHPRAPLAAGA